MMDYSTANIKLTLKEKIGQLFMPAAFINDTEEEIQELELLITQHAVGGICFSTQELVQPPTMKEKKL